MAVDNRAVAASFLACWSVQDVEMTLQHVDESVVYALYISETALPFGGETRGKANCRDVLYAILADFDHLKYEPAIVGVKGDVVRARVEIAYRHRQTGGMLTGSKRLLITVKNGLIVRVEEYHDAAMVEAFMRLTAHRVLTDDVPAPLELPRKKDARRKPPAKPRRRVLRCL